MARIRLRNFVAAALAAGAVSIVASEASADCTCRALGRAFDLGRSVCLQTPNGPRLATCGMVLNNTSWHISDTPCLTVRTDPLSAPELARRAPAQPHRHGG